MKVSPPLASAVLILLVAGVSYGGWRIYQGHLSGDLRRTLIAAADPTASNADIHAYLRRARLQVRTDRDAEVFGKLATSVQLRDIVLQHELLVSQRSLDEANKSANSVCGQLGRLGIKELESPRGHALLEECGKEQAVEKAQSDSLQKQMALDQENMERAQSLLKEFRNELGLPAAGSRN